MNTTYSTIVQRVWNYCNVLRDDGISYGDYVEQLTYLIFLKMDDENAQFGKPSAIPEDLRWRALLKKDGVTLDGEALEAHYIHVLASLGKQPGMIGVIFRKAQNRIQNPARLRQGQSRHLPGYATRRSKIRPTCPIQMCWRARSSKTCWSHWSNSRTLRRGWQMNSTPNEK